MHLNDDGLPCGPWNRPLWQIVPAVFLGNTGIALVLWLCVPRSFVDYWVVSNCVGYGIYVSQIALIHLIPRKGWLPFAVSLGLALGAPLGLWVASLIGSDPLQGLIREHRWQTVRFTTVGVMCGVGFSLLWHNGLRVRELQAREREAVLRESQREKQALEAHLKLLQAQIEPHFLFNTLANLYSLIDTDPPRARHMLEQLNHYLRASLVHSRAERATLADECRLLNAYLEIQKIRMGPRLSYRIEIDEKLQDLPFPPMLLQPLVENALQHGIEPSVEGGEVVLTASRSGGTLCLRVSDTGRGFSTSTSGSGVGLSNIRERLKTLYSGKARLDLLQNTPRGVSAELWIPDSAS